MSTDDLNQQDDAEFERFLKREGVLSQQLQGIAQPVPSPELDAAIFARAEAALSGVRSVDNVAANDPRIHTESMPRKPTFAKRWGPSMGLAACLMVAVSVGNEWRRQQESVAMNSAPMSDQKPVIPAAAAPAAGPPMAAPAPAADETSNASGRRADVPKKSAPASTLADSSNRIAQKVSPRTTDKSSDQNANASAIRERTIQADSAPVALARNAGPVLPSPEAAPQAVESNATVAPPVMPVPVPAAAPRASTNFSAAASPAPVAAAPMPSPPPAGAATQSRRAENAVADLRSNRLEAQERDASMRSGTEPTDPKVWIAQIQDLLKVGSQERALEEWVKFRRAFPNYSAPADLSTKLDALKK